MAVKLPDFKGSFCKAMTVCAELKSDDKSLLKWIEAQPLMISRYKAADGPAYVILILGGLQSKHVHIDVIRNEVFKDRHAPKSVGKMADIQKAAAHLIGHEIDAVLRGEFWVAFADLPLIISAAHITAVEGDVSLKTVGGSLVVQGAPISGIDWSMRDADGKVRIVLTSRKKLTISESYVMDSLELLETSFQAFILERSHGKTTN